MTRCPAPLPGFDFTSAMRLLCDDMTRRLPELRHIRMQFVAVGFCQVRKNVLHGLQASLTPLRFEGGASTTVVGGKRYRSQRMVSPSGEDFLYLLNFYLPRYLKLSAEEKLATAVHELWHIGPDFDGDIRRHEGRCYVHGRSQREFDAHSHKLARQWLAKRPPRRLYSFLELSFDQLRAKHGQVFGERFRAPRLEPCDAA